MDFRRFKEEFERNEPLRSLVLRYVQYGALITSKLAACNRLHDVEQRLAHWLLMVSDRVGNTAMQLTQEFLAEMVGSRRTTVTLAIGNLQRSRIIENQRGRIQIVDATALQALACECYAVTYRLYHSLYE